MHSILLNYKGFLQFGVQGFQFSFTILVLRGACPEHFASLSINSVEGLKTGELPLSLELGINLSLVFRLLSVIIEK